MLNILSLLSAVNQSCTSYLNPPTLFVEIFLFWNELKLTVCAVKTMNDFHLNIHWSSLKLN